MADLSEGFWEDLLDYVEDRAVVPALGPELVTVLEGDREVLLYRWVAERLAADLELPAAELPGDFGLNDVVSLHLRRRGEREELYPHIRMLRPRSSGSRWPRSRGTRTTSPASRSPRTAGGWPRRAGTAPRSSGTWRAASCRTPSP